MAKLILFQTDNKFHLGGEFFKVYENIEKHLYVHVENVYGNYVAPILWGDRPFQSNEAAGGDFTHESITLGRKIKKDFALLKIARWRYKEIQEDPATAIAELVISLRSNLKELDYLSESLTTHAKHIDNLQKQVNTNTLHIHNIGKILKRLHNYLREAFGHKKWRKRIDKRFFNEITDEELTDEDNIPF